MKQNSPTEILMESVIIGFQIDGNILSRLRSQKVQGTLFISKDNKVRVRIYLSQICGLQVG